MDSSRREQYKRDVRTVGNILIEQARIVIHQMLALSPKTVPETLVDILDNLENM